MRHKTLALLVGVILLHTNGALATLRGPSVKLKEVFPYSTLGDDHGILNKHDLQTNACEVRPLPFPPPPKANAFQYWQCFETKNIATECDPNWTDAVGSKLGLVTVDATRNGFRHEYLMNHPWPLGECKQFDRRIKRLLKKGRYACVSGHFYNEVTESGERYGMWTFDRIKTKRGCEGTSRCNPMSQKELRDTCPKIKF